MRRPNNNLDVRSSKRTRLTNSNTGVGAAAGLFPILRGELPLGKQKLRKYQKPRRYSQSMEVSFIECGQTAQHSGAADFSWKEKLKSIGNGPSDWSSWARVAFRSPDLDDRPARAISMFPSSAFRLVMTVLVMGGGNTGFAYNPCLKSEMMTDKFPDCLTVCPLCNSYIIHSIGDPARSSGLL